MQSLNADSEQMNEKEKGKKREERDGEGKKKDLDSLPTTLSHTGWTTQSSGDPLSSWAKLSKYPTLTT